MNVAASEPQKCDTCGTTVNLRRGTDWVRTARGLHLHTVIRCKACWGEGEEPPRGFNFDRTPRAA